MSDRPIVYIASPYTKGDPCINTHCQMRAFDELMDDGIVWPVIPLLSHFQHSFAPRGYRDWIAYDLAMLERYDACLRIDAVYPKLNYHVGESSGADGEVAAMRQLGKPIFYDKAALYEWAKGWPHVGTGAKPANGCTAADGVGPACADCVRDTPAGG